jgi:hypothetical protein
MKAAHPEEPRADFSTIKVWIYGKIDHIGNDSRFQPLLGSNASQELGWRYDRVGTEQDPVRPTWKSSHELRQSPAAQNHYDWLAETFPEKAGYIRYDEASSRENVHYQNVYSRASSDHSGNNVSQANESIR